MENIYYISKRVYSIFQLRLFSIDPEHSLGTLNKHFQRLAESISLMRYNLTGFDHVSGIQFTSKQ